MGYDKYTNQFREQAAKTASPLQLVIMLYDGAIRFCDIGIASMKKRDIEAQNNNIQRAQRIILELMACLDMENGGEIAKNLMGLYTYCVNQLVEANVYDQSEPIERVKKILSDLRSSWVAIESQFGGSEEQPLAA